jgi:hypothetical protein
MSLRQAAEQIIAWYAEGQRPTGDDIVDTLREALAQPERRCEAGVSLQDLWDCWDAVHGGQEPIPNGWQLAIDHYEKALKAGWPNGAKAEVFDHWNEARKALLFVAPKYEEQSK